MQRLGSNEDNNLLNMMQIVQTLFLFLKVVKRFHLHIKYIPQGISVYPPNTYWLVLMIVTVLRFPSQLLWKVLADQP